MMRHLCVLVVTGFVVITSPQVLTRSQEPSRTVSPDVLTNSDRAWPLMRTQVPLIAAADRLQSFIRAAARRSSVTGFGSIELDVEARAVYLYWKAGEPIPADLEDLVREITREGVTVSFGVAPYSHNDLSAEAIRLLDAVPPSAITEVSLLPMAAGLFIELNAEADSPQAREQVEAVRSRFASRRSRRFGLSTASDIALAKGHPKRWFSRHDDAAPWKGGGEISMSGGGCSTGFAVGSWFGRYMLTAGHCGWWTDNAQVWDGAGQLMGSTEGARDAKRLYRDSALIRLRTSNIGRIYDGGVGIGEFTKPVKGPIGSHVNQYVCTSGAFSGVRCDIKVESTVSFMYDYMGNKFGPQIKARQVDGLTSSGDGDSGGPVFALDARSNVLAAGIINGGDSSSQTACTGIVYDSRYGSRHCSSVTYYTDIWTLLNGHGVWLETN
jgi:hypothetical protein